MKKTSTYILLLLLLSFSALQAQTDQHLFSWGANYAGQLGDGTTIEKNSPAQVGSDTDWKVVVAKESHTLALKTDGTLWAWGRNDYGQLGDGTATGKSSPVQIGTDADWQAVSTGPLHTVALKNDGMLWAWGFNGRGQLGNGARIDEYAPVQIDSNTDWQVVCAGSEYTVALKTDGTLWAWGRNDYGQLGDGTATDKYLPIQIGSETDWKTVTAGGGHTVALKNDGMLWAWGDNNYGQLGDGTATDRSSPVQIDSNTDWQVVCAGSEYTVALKTDGTLWAWGRNDYGQLGDGTATDKYLPIQIGSETDWKTVAAGGGHTVALKNDGTLWAWGRNDFGQLGDGTTIDKLTPIQIGSDTNWQAVMAGENYTIALKPKVNLTPLISAQTFDIVEQSAVGTVVGTVQASDPDGDELTYSIVAGNDQSAFAIDATTGKLTVSNSEVLIYATSPTFNLTIEVIDGSQTASAIITVNLYLAGAKQAPIISAQTFNIAEKSAIGLVVGTVQASDANDDVLTFSITAGNEQSAFAIEANTGKLTVSNSEVLDYTTNPIFHLTIEVSDGNLTASAIMTISVITLNREVVSGLVKDIYAGDEGSIRHHFGLYPFKNNVYFIASDGTSLYYELYKSDGTTTGTIKVPGVNGVDVSRGGPYLQASTQYLYFHEDNGNGKGSIVCLDENHNKKTIALSPIQGSFGVHKGKNMVVYSDQGADFSQNTYVFNENSHTSELLVSDYFPYELLPHNGEIFFFGSDQRNQNHPPFGKTDGTVTGTSFISENYLSGFKISIGNTFYFTSYVSDLGGDVLFRSDGTPAGTVQMNNFYGEITHMTNLNGTLVFNGRQFTSNKLGYELYKVQDGEVVLVKDIFPGETNGLGVLSFTLDEYQPVVLDNIMYFMGESPDVGRELWRSDGTAQGTYLVKDIYPGRGDSDPRWLTVANGKLYFAADDATTIYGDDRLWELDVNSLALKKINLPVENISQIKQLNNLLFFTARSTELNTGTELFVYNLADSLECDVVMPEVSQSGSTLTSSSAVGNQWLKDNELIPGAIDQHFLPTEPGHYSVQVTEGECSAMSEPFTFKEAVTSIHPLLTQSSVSVYPNPVKDELQIRIDKEVLADKQVEIYTLLGTKKESVLLLEQDNKLQGKVNLSSYTSGIYILVLHTRSGKQAVKIQKI